MEVMEVMEEMVGVKRESVTCLVVRLELERSISVFTSFLEVSTINMAVEVVSTFWIRKSIDRFRF